MTEKESTRRAEEEEEKDGQASDEHVPEGEVIYRAIKKDGDHALGESSGALAWSGLAAGLSMGFSLAGEGLLKAHLPDAMWTPLVSKFGYALGFLMVILGRQQLFTEQTLTAMLPLFSAHRSRPVAVNVSRVWAIVLIANLVGTAGFAAIAAWTPAFSPDVQAAFLRIGHDALAPAWSETFVRAVVAGYLIATMVWLLPGAGPGRLWIVLILAYIVGVAGLSHIIAGSAECLFVVFKRDATFGAYLADYLLHGSNLFDHLLPVVAV